ASVESPPRRVDLQERVLDEQARRHPAIIAARLPRPGARGPRRIEYAAVRIALLSPYSWTYPGGVTRHIEGLAGELTSAGHDVRVLAPYDPDDARARRMHRGARPQERTVPAGFVSLGRSFGIPANGAVSNMALTPHAVFRMREELRHGGYDVL